MNAFDPGMKAASKVLDGDGSGNSHRIGMGRGRGRPS